MGKTILLITSFILTGIAGFFLAKKLITQPQFFEISKKEDQEDRPLDIYSIEALKIAEIPNSKFTLIEQSENLFELEFSPSLDPDIKKKTTGVIHIPKGTGPFPIVIMIRGYVDQEIYTSGVGTDSAAKYFAQGNFITISPDFLGYGGSDPESGNVFETRFQTYTTILSLLQSIKEPSFAQVLGDKWDQKNIFIWAHSNGGHIALTTLIITGTDYPTTLWAPVTKPFPYNVLYYTDEAYDGGKLIRKELARFEDVYETDKFSFTNYLGDIKAPIQLHQGAADDAVPVEWNRKFVADKSDIKYFEYPNTDHNLKPNWNLAMSRDLIFFRELTK